MKGPKGLFLGPRRLEQHAFHDFPWFSHVFSWVCLGFSRRLRVGAPKEPRNGSRQQADNQKTEAPAPEEEVARNPAVGGLCTFKNRA